jgi:hypothetical protein
MKILKSKRVKGKGLATQNGYPTINVQFELDSIEEGLWLCILMVGSGWSSYSYKSIASVSKYKDALCTEVHALENFRTKVKVDEEVSIMFLRKLRDKVTTKDPIKQIRSDIRLANDTTLTTCETCDRFYSQDTGYSNWTVEGTSYGCYANVFEEVEDNDGVKYNADECKHYTEGEMWQLDVDGESDQPSEAWLKSVERDVKLKEIGI